MTVLYDILTAIELKELPQDKKIEFLSEIITVGRIDYYEKFIPIMETDFFSFISSEEILALLPMMIDPQLFELILSHYDFEQGQHFFFNYALHNEDDRIKEMVYNYFVDNHSHVLIDNMKKYQVLIES